MTGLASAAVMVTRGLKIFKNIPLHDRLFTPFLWFHITFQINIKSLYRNWGEFINAYIYIEIKREGMNLLDKPAFVRSLLFSHSLSIGYIICSVEGIATNHKSRSGQVISCTLEMDRCRCWLSGACICCMYWAIFPWIWRKNFRYWTI